MKANSTRVLLTLLFAALFLLPRTYAQCGAQQPIAIDFSHLVCNSSTMLLDFKHFPNSNGDDAIWVYDYTLPTNVSGTLNLKIKGGNGGDASIDCSGPVHRGNGGVGAFISGTVAVGDSQRMIPRGSTIRYIIGERGQSSLDVYTGDQYVRGGGGGGSSAVLYHAPNDSVWRVLMIAGGGGGGCAECYPTIDYDLPIPLPVLYTAHEDGYPGGLTYLAEYRDSIDANGNLIEVECEDSWSSLPCYMQATVPLITIYTLNDDAGGHSYGNTGGGGGGGLNGTGGEPGACQNGCSGGQTGQGWLNYPAGNAGPGVYGANVVSCAGTQSRAGGRGFSGGGAAYNHIGEAGAGGGGGLKGGMPGGGSGSTFARAEGGTSYIERSLIAPNWVEKVDTTGALDGYGNFNFTPTQASMAVQPILTAATTLAPPYCDGTPVSFVARPTYLNGDDDSNFGNLASNVPVYTWKVNGTQVATGQNFADSTAVINYQSGDVVTCQFWAKDSNGCERSATPIATLTLPERNDPAADSHVEITITPDNPICERRVYDQFGGYNLEAWATFKASAHFLPQAWDNGTGDYFYADANSSAQTMALRACEVEYGVGNCTLGSSQYFCTERPAINNTDLILSGAHAGSAAAGFPVGKIVTGESPCGGFDYYYETGTSQTSPLPGARQFVFNGAPGAITVNQDYSTKIVGGNGSVVALVEMFGQSYYETTYYSGYDTIMYTSRFGDTITGMFPFTRTLQNNHQWGLTTSNLGTVPYAGTTDYVPTYNWFLNGVVLGTQASYTDNNGVSHIYTIPFTSDTMWIRYLQDGDVVTCTASSNHCPTPDTSNSITVQVLPAAHGGIISGPLHPCPGSYVTYTVTGATDVVDYLWTINGNVGNITGTGNTRSFYVDSTDVQLMCIPAGQCGGGDTAYFTVSPSHIITGPCTSSSVITTGPLVRCQGQSQVVTLSPHVIGDCYQWSNGATSQTLTVLDDGNYYVYVDGCKSEVITVSSVAPQQPVVNIAIAAPYPGEEGAWCRTNTHKAILATVTNYTGNPNLNFKWYRNGFLYSTSGTPLFLDLYDFNSFDTLQCTVTLSDSCAATVWSNKVVLPGIFDGGATGLSIQRSSPYGCDGDTITFTAVPTNGGDTPTYNWYVHGNFVSEHSNTFKYARTLTNGYAENFPITCTLIGSPLTCRTGSQYAQVTFDNYIYPKVVPTAIISSPVTNVCPDGSITFRITGDNHGNATTYEWFKNGNPIGGDSATYIDATPTDGATVYCRITNNDGQPCVTSTVVSNTLTEDVYVPLIPIPTATPDNLCVLQNVALNATLSPLPGDYTHIGFRDAYGINNWTAYPACGSGGINTNAMPSSFVTNVMHYNAAGANCNHDMFMTMPENATVSFDWSYVLTGTATDDVPYFLVDGVLHQLPGIDYNNSQSSSKNGHYSVAVLQGQTITFRLRSLVGNTQTFPSGASVTFSNFGVETQPSIKWYNAPTAGTLLGTTTSGQNLSVTPQFAGTTTYYAEAAGAQATCGQRAPISVIIHAPDASTQTVSACESYTWIDGNTYTASNSTATHTLTGVNGCDSVVTLNLTIKTPTTGTDVVSACESYTWIDGNTYTTNNSTATHTLTGVNGCDSVVTLNLTIKTPTTGTHVVSACESYTWIDGNTYTASNTTATHTLTGVNGCDSVVTLNLTIKTPATGTDVISACESYTWIDGNTYTANNSTATHTLTGVNGCDSVVTLNLTIKTPTTGTDVVSACESYTWIDGNTYTTNNSTATHTLTGVNGCDSVVTLNLTIKTPTTGTDVVSTCESYTWIDGNTYTTNNSTATHTLTGVNGCDSVVTLNLTIKTPTTGTDVVSACESYTWIDGNTYTTNNSTATHTLTGVNGCDSVVTLNLTIKTPTTGTDIVSACESYTWIDGNTYTTNNSTATHTLTGVNGCDSVVTLNLTIKTPTTGTDVVSACESYTWIDGNTYTTNNSTAIHTLTGVNGCDSVVTLNLTIHQSSVSNINQSICTGDSYNFNGTLLSAAGTYTDTLSAVNGCDSVVNLTLNSWPLPAQPVITQLGDTLICSPATSDYNWYLNNNAVNPLFNNQPLGISQTGYYEVEVIDSNGCTNRSEVLHVVSIGIKDLASLYEVKLFPNPSTGTFVVTFSDMITRNVSIIDMSGRLILDAGQVTGQHTFTLNVAEGLYILSVNQSGILKNIMFSILR